MAKRKGKKAKKFIRKRIKKAASDNKVTKKETKRIRNKAQKKSINLKRINIKKQIKNVAKKKSAKSIRLKIKKAARDGKVTRKELKKIRKQAKNKSVNLKKLRLKKQVKKYVKKRSSKSIKLQIKKAGKDGKVTRKEVNKIQNKAKKKGINTKQLGIKFNTNKALKKQFKTYAKKQKKKGDKGTIIGKPAMKTIKKIKGKGGAFKKIGIKGDKQLDKFLEKNVLEKPILQSPKRTKDSWKPNRVERQVAKQWGKRFKSDDFKPKRLDIKAKSTGRLGKYTDEKGNFNQKQYLADVRQSTISRAEKRGFKGDAAKALSRTGPKMPGVVKPKYGSAITELKNKLGKINYKNKIAETTSKLTGEVKSNASAYKDTGLDIIKRRSSEDGALPAAKLKQKLK